MKASVVLLSQLSFQIQILFPLQIWSLVASVKTVGKLEYKYFYLSVHTFKPDMTWMVTTILSPWCLDQLSSKVLSFQYQTSTAFRQGGSDFYF